MARLQALRAVLRAVLHATLFGQIAAESEGLQAAVGAALRPTQLLLLLQNTLNTLIDQLQAPRAALRAVLYASPQFFAARQVPDLKAL